MVFLKANDVKHLPEPDFKNVRISGTCQKGEKTKVSHKKVD